MTIPRRAFIKQTAISAGSVAFLSLIGESLFAAPGVLALAKSTPEAEGISSASILRFVNAAEKNNLGLHSLMILRNGKIVTQGWWDPFKPDLKHMLFSLSKSFTSTAIGFAISEGLIKLDTNIIDLFPKDLPDNPSANLNAMQVKHLLSMSTGHERDTSAAMRKGETWAKGFLALPVEKEPGTYFLYNSGATYMLSAIITKLTGKTLIEYLTPRLFKPLDIVDADWESSPQGVNTGGWGLRVKTEDIAKLGQLYLQNGKWNGKQVLPDGWAAKATSFQVSNANPNGKDENSDWQQGYGYQFWRCRHNFFRGDGAQGQFCLVSRDLNTVIAITSEIQNMQKTLNYVWDHLLPGIQPASLPADNAGHTALKQKMASLTLLPQKTSFGGDTQTKVSGKVYTVQSNPFNIGQASVSFTKADAIISLKANQTEHKITAGLDKWIYGETAIPGAPAKDGKPAKVTAAGVWVDDNTFRVTLQYYETPGSDLLTFRFQTDDTVRIEFLNGMTAKNGGTKDSRPPLEGKA